MSINDILRGATPSQNVAHWSAMKPGTAITIGKIAVRKDGTTYPVEVSVSCELVRGRKLFMGLGRDVSEREGSRAALNLLNSELESRVADRTEELRAALAKLQAVMDSAHDVIVFRDRAGRFQMFNRAAERLTGVSQRDAIGKNTLEIFGTDLGRHLKEAENDVLATGKLSIVEQTVLIGGEERIFLVTRTPHRDNTVTISGLVAIGHDITELRRSEQAARLERDRLSLAAKVGGLGIWDYDLVGGALQCDAQWYRVMGLAPGTLLRSIEDVHALCHPDDAARTRGAFDAMLDPDSDTMMFESVYRIMPLDGESRWIRSAASLVRDVMGTVRRAVGFVVDITSARLAEETLNQEKVTLKRQSAAFEKAAGEDPSTGIANRRRLDQALERACRHALRTGEPLSVAMIDVDHFKRYNDHYGHGQGDKALKAVAEILAWAVHRPYDLAARYGGEEFVLLLPGADRPEAVLESMVAQLVRLGLPHAASPTSALLTLSCGCIVAGNDHLTPVALLAQADAALYRAKEEGRNRIVVVRGTRQGNANKSSPVH